MPSKSSNQAPPPGPVARFFRGAFRPGVLLLAAIAAAGWFLGPTIRRALPPIEERDEYRIRAAEIQVPDMPTWIPEDFVAEATRRAGLREELSLLDEGLTADVAEAFRLHPWVRNVVRVEKSYPARVVARLEFREPVAMVQVQGGMYPIDAHGVLLPPTDFSAAETHRYPAIAGVKSTPQGPAGSSWGDPIVIAAAKVAVALLSEWRELGLVAIRVVEPAKRKPEEMTFELVAPQGSRIVWGRPPGTDHPGELSADQKLGRLKDYRARFGDFDAPQGPYEIDIRHWQEISRRPLAERDTPNRR
ncbi:MAG: hypothetical protein WD066_02310 [Planctomycetaceae bacterium]